MPIEMTKEEDELVHKYILLPLTYRVLVHDTKAIDDSGLKFKGFYYDLVEHALKQLSCDLREIKAEMRKQKIRMIKYDDLTYDAVVRGWTYRIVFHKVYAAEWVEAKLNEYLNR